MACWEDGSARAVYAYCRSVGLKVPEDVALVGFNGVARFNGMGPELTTIGAPWGEVAHTAIGLLLDQIAGKPVPQKNGLTGRVYGG
jgi:LacI family transcriptional regulator